MDIPLYFYAAFKDMDRLAPGSDKSTLKAIGYIDFNKDSQLTILDIGCGVGLQLYYWPIILKIQQLRLLIYFHII